MFEERKFVCFICKKLFRVKIILACSTSSEILLLPNDSRRTRSQKDGIVKRIPFCKKSKKKIRQIIRRLARYHHMCAHKYLWANDFILTAVEIGNFSLRQKSFAIKNIQIPRIPRSILQFTWKYLRHFIFTIPSCGINREVRGERWIFHHHI